MWGGCFVSIKDKRGNRREDLSGEIQRIFSGAADLHAGNGYHWSDGIGVVLRGIP